jgi:hypothetical protein
VDFYSADWSSLSTRWSLRDVIYRATLIAPSEVATQTMKSKSCSVMQRMLEDSEKRTEVLWKGGDEMKLLVGRFRRRGDDALAWTYSASPSNRSFCLGIPELDCRGLGKYVWGSLDHVTLAPENQIGRKRCSTMREPSNFHKFNRVYFKPESPHSELRIYLRNRNEQPILICECLPEQSHAFSRSGGYYVIIPSSMVLKGSGSGSEAAAMLFLPYGSAKKPLEKFLVVVGSEQTDDNEPIVWCVVENRADEQLLKSEYQRLRYRFHEVLERHRNATSDVSIKPHFRRLDRKSIRLSDESSIYILARKRMGILSLHIAMKFDTVEAEVNVVT